MTIMPSVADAAAQSQRFNIGILGGGINSAVGGAHIDALALSRRYRLQAGCFSRNEKINGDSGREYDVEPRRVYKTLDHMLAAEAKRLDVMLILTPTDQHGPQVFACLEAGVPVICEKALSNARGDLERIQSALSRRKGFLAVTYNYLGYPMLRELAHLIRKGRLGRIEQVHIEMPQEGFLKLSDAGEPLVPQPWRLNDDEVPTISLDLGDHVQIITNFLTYEQPLEAIAVSNTYGNFKNIADDVHCLVKYSGGMTANFWYSKTALGYRNGLRVRVFGDNGSAEWVQENPEVLMMATRQGRRYALDRGHPDIEIANAQRYTRFKAGHPAGYIEAFANYYCDTADQLAAHQRGASTRNDYVFNIEDAVTGFSLFEALEKSIETNSWAKVRDPLSAAVESEGQEHEVYRHRSCV